MDTALAPAARLLFAKRLKAIRNQRGFHRARYLASSLGIEENRYTRYERAEVEPSLTLLHKICEILAVTPDQLLGFADFDGGDDPGQLRGFAEGGSGRRARMKGSAREEGDDALAWRLASEVAAIRREQAGKTKAPADPLEHIRETSDLYGSLKLDPFGTVAKILAEPGLDTLEPARKAALAELIEALTRYD